METKAGAAQGWRNAVDRDRQAAIELQNDEGFKAVVKIADDLVREFERLALDCDEKETAQRMGEARGAKRFRDTLLLMLADCAK
jgi:hypothetical protein